MRRTSYFLGTVFLPSTYFTTVLWAEIQRTEFLFQQTSAGRSCCILPCLHPACLQHLQGDSWHSWLLCLSLPPLSPKKRENSPVALIYTSILYPCFNDTLLPQKRTDLKRGSCCYITTKINSETCIPSLSQRREWLPHCIGSTKYPAAQCGRWPEKKRKERKKGGGKKEGK